eukprot:2176388-Rhodomonas_salina.2
MLPPGVCERPPRRRLRRGEQELRSLAGTAVARGTASAEALRGPSTDVGIITDETKRLGIAGTVSPRALGICYALSSTDLGYAATRARGGNPTAAPSVRAGQCRCYASDRARNGTEETAFPLQSIRERKTSDGLFLNLTSVCTADQKAWGRP